MALWRPCRNSQGELRDPPAAAPLLEEATNSICSRCPGLASLGLSSIHRRHDKSLSTPRQFPPTELSGRGSLPENVGVMQRRAPAMLQIAFAGTFAARLEQPARRHL